MTSLVFAIISCFLACDGSVNRLFYSHHGLPCFAWEHFLVEYDTVFQQMQSRTLLQIGVESDGGCLELFSETLLKPQVVKAIGIVGRGCERLVFEGETDILVSCGETLAQADYFTVGELFEVVIEKLSRSGNEVISNLMLFFPKVAPGGNYIIENIGLSYNSMLGGGIGSESSAASMLKSFIEIIHFYYIAEFHTGRFDDFPEGEQYFVHWIDSIKFLDNMVVIRKALSPNMVGGKECATGVVASVTGAIVQNAIDSGQFRNTLEMEDLPQEQEYLRRQREEMKLAAGADTGESTSESQVIPSLMRLYKEHEGHMSVKWVHYLYEYNRLFNPFRGLPVTFLEIGVQNGGSQQIWRKFFGPLSSVYGADIDPKVCDLQLGEGITLYCLDASNATEAAPLLARQYDLIVDDASHINALVIRSFEMLFPLVKPGGIYVVEDVHTSYYRYHYNGGLLLEASSVSYFKRLVDLINFWHVEDEEWKAGLSEFQQYCRDWVKTVRFLDGMIILEKRDTIRTGPYRRIGTGQDSTKT